MIDPYELEEDPYDPCIPDQIYDTVDENASCVLEVLNRPPAPIPRPVTVLEPKLPQTFISRGRKLFYFYNALSTTETTHHKNRKNLTIKKLFPFTVFSSKEESNPQNISREAAAVPGS